MTQLIVGHELNFICTAIDIDDYHCRTKTTNVSDVILKYYTVTGLMHVLYRCLLLL